LNDKRAILPHSARNSWGTRTYRVACVFLLVALNCAATAGTIWCQDSKHLRSPRPATKSLKLIRNGSDLVLLAGGDRLPLPSQWLPSSYGPRTVLLAGNDRLHLDPAPSHPSGYVRILLERNGQPAGSFTTQTLLESWLQNDEIWGGHQRANQVRYMDSGGGGGISGRFVNVTVAGDVAYVLINWHFMGPSFEPIGAQHLIRIRSRPELMIEPLRLLGETYPTFGGISAFAFPLLFKFHGGPIIFESDGLHSLNLDGSSGRLVAASPKGFNPIGLVDGRWLLIGRSDDQEPNPVKLLDLELKKVISLAGNWKLGWSSYSFCIPERGRKILSTEILRQTNNGSDMGYYVLTIPKGTRIRLAASKSIVGQYLWHGMAVLVDDKWVEGVGAQHNVVEVFDAGTGRLIRRMQVPPAPAKR
jgi:hypothetical protein